MSLHVPALPVPALPGSGRQHAPTPGGPADLATLTALTREVAEEVRAGRHPVVIDPEQRWYRLLRRNGHVDVWLISWATEQAAELHDHGGSLGALTVVSGDLVERRWTGAGLRSRRLGAGRTLGFPLAHVHDVGNHEPAAAVSVHAYSPPLTQMSYYEVVPPTADSAPRLRRARAVPVAPGSPQEAG